VPRPPRQPSPEELALWHSLMRDVRPLHTGPALAEPPPPPPPAVEATSRAPQPLRPAPALARTTQRLDPSRPVDLDRRSWLRLRRGVYPIDARLDLHGLTQEQAHARLVSFLATAQVRGNRCVLVITGRGLRHGGTLREMTPRWLDEAPNRARVLAYAEAQLRHGGEGALYVLVRRRAPSGGP
jgi:DNA-nicking Smr family endonuclease